MVELIPALTWIALGSALGGAARFAVSGLVDRAVGEMLPWGTLAVNITGALALGALAARAEAAGLAPALWQVAALGFLGSYTTVSSFSLQMLALVRDGAPLRAAANLVLSLGLCIAAAASGYAVAG